MLAAQVMSVSAALIANTVQPEAYIVRSSKP